MDINDFMMLKTTHIPGLFHEAEKWVAYKNISINKAISEICFGGDWFQFGVYKGHTARILESYILGNQKLHLFDSFDGLPEQWENTAYDKGAFRIEGKDIPRFDPSRTVIHKGWFSDTIPAFIATHTKPAAFIHLDADLYSSTITVLEQMNALIVPGTILLFDEFFLPTEKGIADDESRAFFDWTRKHSRQYQFLWKTEWVQLAVKIIK